MSALKTLSRLRPAAGAGAVLAPRAGGAAARRLRLDPSREDIVEHADLHVRARAVARGRPSSGRHRGAVNVYSADAAGDLSPAVRGDPALVYVPNSLSNTVDVISQRTLKVVAQFPVRRAATARDALVRPEDAVRRQRPRQQPHADRPAYGPARYPIPVEDPYNLYFTPDGRFAIVVAERLQRLDFRDPNTMRLVHSLPVPECRGVDHMDFSANGRYAFASCEFAGADDRGRPQHPAGDPHAPDQPWAREPSGREASPDGRTLYTADQQNGGVWEIDPSSFRVIGFLKTGAGAHGLYPSRNAEVMYVANRQAGSISVVSFRTRRVIDTWQLPLPASPDMGVSRPTATRCG